MSKKWDFREVCHFSIAKGYFFIKYSTVAARQKYWKPKECVSQTSCSAYIYGDTKGSILWDLRIQTHKADIHLWRLSSPPSSPPPLSGPHHYKVSQPDWKVQLCNVIHTVQVYIHITTSCLIFFSKKFILLRVTDVFFILPDIEPIYCNIREKFEICERKDNKKCTKCRWWKCSKSRAGNSFIGFPS